MTAPSICDKVDPNDREVKALAEVVWKVVVKKFPFLEEYRDKVRLFGTSGPAQTPSPLGDMQQGIVCAAV